jgi:hypothetical protein
MKYIALYADNKGVAIGLFNHNEELQELQEYKFVNQVSLVDIKSIIEVWENKYKASGIITNHEYFKEQLYNAELVELTNIKKDIVELQVKINDDLMVFNNKIKNEIDNELQKFDESIVNHIIYMLMVGMKYEGCSYAWMREI